MRLCTQADFFAECSGAECDAMGASDALRELVCGITSMPRHKCDRRRLARDRRPALRAKDAANAGGSFWGNGAGRIIRTPPKLQLQDPYWGK